VRPALEHYIKVHVEQPPQIVRPPWADLTNEGDRLKLECEATGVPTPEIYWLLNGHSSIDDSEAELSNNFLILHSVLKRHRHRRLSGAVPMSWELLRTSVPKYLDTLWRYPTPEFTMLAPIFAFKIMEYIFLIGKHEWCENGELYLCNSS